MSFGAPPGPRLAGLDWRRAVARVPTCAWPPRLELPGVGRADTSAVWRQVRIGAARPADGGFRGRVWRARDLLDAFRRKRTLVGRRELIILGRCSRD
ncbi:hypothetical protein Zmor_027825 [Zophobas morio]|uniref:Uncharacterized protein n=1 Tax=Zophobas morio TaxID=2755281 RepID=A0AA38HNY1_9CUCU|nr:hypothetical protein Zmor_027825 [Zophobas morio]